jgi:hypothetical protein
MVQLGNMFLGDVTFPTDLVNKFRHKPEKKKKEKKKKKRRKKKKKKEKEEKKSSLPRASSS